MEEKEIQVPKKDSEDVQQQVAEGVIASPAQPKEWKAGKLVPYTAVLGILALTILGWWVSASVIHPSKSEFFPYVTLAVGVLSALYVYMLLNKVVTPYTGVVSTAQKNLVSNKAESQRYELALRGLKDGFWDLNLETGEVYFSKQWFGMLGYAPSEETKDLQWWHSRIHPEDMKAVKTAIEFHSDRRTPTYAVEYRIKKKNGEMIWVRDQGKALWNTEKKAVRMAGITMDITNERRVAEVLKSRTSELQSAKDQIEAEIQNVKKFQKAVDSSTEAISITDPKGAIVYVNPAWENLNRYTFEEVQGRNPKLLKSDKTDPSVYAEMWEKLVAGIPFTSEDIINNRKDGTQYQMEISIFPIRENDENLFYVSLSQDITKRKEVDKAKTEFVSLASHQLRTPLSAIRWYSEMLLSKYAGELNEKQKQYIKEIYQGNLRMVDLVNALLNVSRIDLGTFAIEPEPTNFIELCDSVLSELLPQISAKKQKVHRIYGTDIPLIPADPKLLRIIFQNFLSNSVKYTPEKGQIAVEISRRDPDIYIRVTDSGYGIPKEQQPKIFEKLFRADNVRQKDTEGTGLGMYIVKAIVDASNGKIWFESDEDQGTTFHVTLPLSGMPKKVGAKGLT